MSLKAKSYGGRKMPKSEARPLGTMKRTARKKIEKEVDSAASVKVDLPQSAPEAIPQPATVELKEQKIMTLTYTSLSTNGKRANFSGIVGGLSIPLTKFPGKTAPASFEVADGVFAEAVVKQPKVKLTAEERKALRAARPKPTLAELAAKAQEHANKLAAKAAAAAQM